MVKRWLLALRIWLLVVVGPIVFYRVSLDHLHLGVSTSLIFASLVPLITVVDQALRRGTLEVVGLLAILVVAVKLVVGMVGGSPKLILLSDAFVSSTLAVALSVSLILKRPIFTLLRGEVALPWSSGDKRRALARNSVTFGATANAELPKGELHKGGTWDDEKERGTSDGDWRATVIWAISLAIQALVHVSLVFSLSYSQMVAINGVTHLVFIGATMALTVWVYRRRPRVVPFN